jgi:cytochrome P450/nitrite reductase/ring-hydroxylating ferredoxin subunit
MKERVSIADVASLPDDSPAAARVGDVDLVLIKHAGAVAVFQGRCPHQGVLLAEGTVEGGVLTCRGHGWRFDCASGVKVGEPQVCLKKFSALVERGQVWVDRDEIAASKRASGSAGSASASAAPKRSISDLPGPKGVPLLGNVLQFDVSRLHLILEQWCRTFGPEYAFRLINRLVVVIADPEQINYMLHNRPELFRRISAIEAISREMGVSGVFSAEGDSWRRQRRLVMQALDTKHLRQFFPKLGEVTRRLKAHWDLAAVQGRAVDVQKDLMRYTVDVTTSLAFGYDMNTLEKECEVIQQHLERIFPMVNRRINAPFRYWHYFKLPSDRALDQALQAVRHTIGEFITHSRERLAQDPERAQHPTNFLEAMLAEQQESQAALSDQEIFGNVFTMLLAGEDTTANTMAWMMHFMCRYPQVQSRMQEEVDTVLRDADVMDDIRLADQLAYVDAVALETMRLKPVAPVLFVEPNEDVDVNGLRLPKGTTVMMPTRYNSTLETNFSAADEFKPERWLAGATGSIHHRTGFVPFGSGPRLCPGRSLALLEIKTAMSMVCRSFALSEGVAAAEVGEAFVFTMMPTNLRVAFSARTHSQG